MLHQGWRDLEIEIGAEETWNQHGTWLSDRCNWDPYLVPLLAKHLGNLLHLSEHSFFSFLLIF